MPLIRTECFIPASPTAVWAVLADFDRYSEWNPLNVEARGEARLGARMFTRFRNLAGDPDKTVGQTVRIVACEPGRELAWAGNVPLLFKGRHGFLLTPEGQGTRVVQTEALSGLLPMLWSEARIERDFVPAYAEVDRALAARVAASV
ncbi:SRPBCC domain-containing protein [Caulobacter segnis]|uniref:SRPBCC domain-containing protein n=1 Tax=Caulobacter segnis TaxID=88688 RepID=UPI0024108ED4|nr:SRPBCC domain-containing protein [Caulobacter segnis]MDG2522841.1 SRPBCC domain-containing protein [Caulobacter segnis]